MSFRQRIVLPLLVALATATIASAQQPAVDPDLLPPAEFDVQSRGPLHEAFAQPGDPKLDAMIPIPKQPPAPIREAPPEMRPDNDAMQWVPGYWTWDADRQDFTWVSGVYREPPPGRRFVPGHWIQEGTSFRWVSGFWATENLTEVAYVPEPPAPLETAATTPQPDPNTVFVPGYWVYQGGRYGWRAGYWSPHRAGRIWVAPRYVWSPNGYIFVDGYWDYPLENRGMIFASVSFSQPVYLQANYVYRPRFVVSVGAVTDSLFVAPGAFYYGDYYGPAYVRLGFHPWWEHNHDPIWAYYSWHHRNDPVWAVNVRRVYADRLAGRIALPPRTYAAQLRLGVNIGGVNVAAVVPLKTVAAGGMVGANFRVVRNEHIAMEQAHIERMHEVAAARAIAERRAIGGAAPASMKLPPPAIHAPLARPATTVTSTPTIQPHPSTIPTPPAGTTTTPPFHPVPTPTPTTKSGPTLQPTPQHTPPGKGGPPMPQPKSGTPMPTSGQPSGPGSGSSPRGSGMSSRLTPSGATPAQPSLSPLPARQPMSTILQTPPSRPNAASPTLHANATSTTKGLTLTSGRDADRSR